VGNYVALDFAVDFGRTCAAPSHRSPLYIRCELHYRGFAGEFTWNPFWFLRVFLAGLWPWLVALVLFTGRRSSRLVAALLAPAGLGLAGFFGINQIMGHLGRFSFPALPFIVVAGALAFDRWWAAAPPPLPPRARAWVARAAGAAVLLVGGGRALTAAGARYEARAATQPLAPLDGYTVTATVPLPDLDSWRSSQEMAAFARAAPPGTRFAMSEHGLVGASAPDATIIDVLGLHDPIFARAAFRAAELWRRDPDVIWMPHPDHTQMVRDILDSDELWARFDFFPDVFSYGVAVRRVGNGSYAFGNGLVCRCSARSIVGLFLPTARRLQLSVLRVGGRRGLSLSR